MSVIVGVRDVRRRPGVVLVALGVLTAALAGLTGCGIDSAPVARQLPRSTASPEFLPPGLVLPGLFPPQPDGNAPLPTGSLGAGATTQPPTSCAACGPGADGGTPAWTPTDPLPSPPTDRRPVDVVLSPHPDDETLSLGVWAANAAARGDRVIVVCLTDGRGTAAAATIARRLGHPFTRDDVAAARIRELRAASAALGVAPGDVYLGHLDAHGGGLTTPAAGALIAAFANRFPEATFATMSPVAERHPDHLALGVALARAAETGTVRHAAFAVSRLWWALPSPPTTDVLPASAAVRARVLAALNAYGLWDPAHGRFAVGTTSVVHQFEAGRADPRNRLHEVPDRLPDITGGGSLGPVPSAGRGEEVTAVAGPPPSG